MDDADRKFMQSLHDTLMTRVEETAATSIAHLADVKADVAAVSQVVQFQGRNLARLNATVLSSKNPPPLPPAPPDKDGKIVLTIPPLEPGPPTLAHRAGDLEAKVDQLLKAQGLADNGAGLIGRLIAFVGSREGRKRAVQLATLAAALYAAAAHGALPAAPSAAPLPSASAPR